MAGHDIGLHLEQAQKLIITNELRQALTVLQLPVLELQSYIERELEENPLLERQDDVEHEALAGDEETEAEWLPYFDDSSDLGIPQERHEPQDQEYSLAHPTLFEHLLSQVRLSLPPGRERLIAEYLIGNIDEAGYLRVDAEEAAAALGVPRAKVDRVVALIQTFDPPGVAARDLTECLLLQLRDRGIEDVFLERIIREHLEDVGHGRWRKIARLTGAGVAQVRKAAEIIKTLDPKPGRNFFGSTGVRYLTPDVTIKRVGGDYVVLVNDAFLPRLAISQSYRRILGSADCDVAARRFITRKLQAAQWLMKSIEQRRFTLHKITACLVDLQRAFLDHGLAHLRPLNLQEVADRVGVHPSTVSRAIANKYVETPRGTYKMKFFFQGGVGSAATASIRQALAELVAAEDPRRPLTDDDLVAALNRLGYAISRRTVTKYRSEMGIPPVQKRRRY
ncbi:MAG: RNA polymerase factor sigma-54 [Desulfotomaculales bacterium]